MIHTLAPDCDACFTCPGCWATVCADNHPPCTCADVPLCPDCCEREHGGVECRETAREKAISQGDE